MKFPCPHCSQRLVATEESLTTVDTYRQWVADTFHPAQQLIKVPFSHTTPDGQQATGFIDLLLLTSDGPIIFDRKIYPGSKSTWDETALSYSGQLALYREVVSTAFPHDPEPKCWIHLVSLSALRFLRHVHSDDTHHLLHQQWIPSSLTLRGELSRPKMITLYTRSQKKES